MADQNLKTDRATVLQSATTQDSCGTAGPRLVVVSGLLLGYQLEIGDRPVTIGRTADCTIALPHPSVSRLHCRIFNDGGRFRIEDLGSTNHTFLNGKPINRAELRDGDQIGIGSNALKFFVGESMEARYHDELIDLAIYDSLTGFYNRRRFQNLLVEEVARSLRYGRPLCLLMLDLDYFKSINDRHGHLVGDQALSEVARILRDHAPPETLIGRFGGEEFAMLLVVALDAAAAAAEQLRAAVAARPLALRDLELPVTLSIGVAQCASNSTAVTLLSAADAQLYRAKQGGRNRVACAA